MNKGFIKIDRSFFEGDDWKQQRTFSRAEAWIDLFQCARFEDGSVTKRLVSGRVVNIKQGEIHASLRYLARRWGWGVEKTKRFIDSAKKKHLIEHRTEQGESVISICKYDSYVCNSGASPNTKPNTKPNTERIFQNLSNTNRTPSDTLNNTNNKNVKNVKKDSSSEESKEKYVKKENFGFENPERKEQEAGQACFPVNSEKEKKEKKVSPKKERKEANGFLKPSVDDLMGFFKEKVLAHRQDDLNALQGFNERIEAQRFFNFYDSKGWFVGKNKMKRWRGAAANWFLTAIQKEKMKEKPAKSSLSNLLQIHEMGKRMISEKYKNNNNGIA